MRLAEAQLRGSDRWHPKEIKKIVREVLKQELNAYLARYAAAREQELKRLTVLQHLTRFEEGLQAQREPTEKRFAAVDKRFEGTNRRFEAINRRFRVVDKRLEAVDRRFPQLT